MNKYTFLALTSGLGAIAYILRRNYLRHRMGFYCTIPEPNLHLFYSYVLGSAIAGHIWFYGYDSIGLKQLAWFIPEGIASFILWVILYGCLDWVAKSRPSYACYKRLIGDHSPVSPRPPRLPRRDPYEHSSVRMILMIPVVFMLVVAIVIFSCIESAYDSIASQGKLATPFLPSL